MPSGKKYASLSSFEEFFRLYYRKVREFAFLILKDNADADEVAQLCFIKLWDKRARLGEVLNLDAFVFTVVRNTTLDFIRSLDRSQKGVANMRNSMATQYDSHEESRLDAEIIRNIVHEVIEQMPRKRREVYQMSREEGLSSDQISEALGISKRTAEKHLQLALSQLRTRLRDYIS